MPRMDKIIVAIHGIGSQLRSDTIRSVARRFGERSSPPLPVMPLGFFNLGNTAEVRVSRLDTAPSDPLARIGFAEVYWADIPAQVVKMNDTLEETKAWGRTIVSRAEATYRSEVSNGRLTPEDFQLGVSVVEEIIEAVGVIDNLLAITAKAGIFKFELGPLLRDFVGDVQLVTDFPFYRQQILYRFHHALAQVAATYEQLYPGHTPDIYIVAHSEGTVISFLGLLEALSGRSTTNPNDNSSEAVPVDNSWIKYVRGYMTIGSPLDKHIALWPKLWDGMKLESTVDPSGSVLVGDLGTPRLILKQQIKWRNYYDLGDPIGFKLDTTVAFLRNKGCTAFEFVTKDHDFGFSRYFLPGKAHNEYWHDPDVFGHFIEDVVLQTGEAKPPTSSVFVDKISTLIPYVLAFMLHLAAVFVLYKAVTLAPDSESAAQFDRLSLQIVLLSGLLFSITVAARLPCLVKPEGPRWPLVALGAFILGAIPCIWALPPGAASFLGDPITEFLLRVAAWRDFSWPNVASVGANAQAGKVSLLLASFAIVAAAWLAQRRPKIGPRLLLGCGTLVIAFIIARRLSVEMAIWPVVLAGLAFLYLWWLGILLFDLSFIWHRYIRRSVATDTLFSWRNHEDAKPCSMMGLGAPPARTVTVVVPTS